jgi:hypothetical protein
LIISKLEQTVELILWNYIRDHSLKKLIVKMGVRLFSQHGM